MGFCGCALMSFINMEFGYFQNNYYAYRRYIYKSIDCLVFQKEAYSFEQFNYTSSDGCKA